jgi:hypothetical protein
MEYILLACKHTRRLVADTMDVQQGRGNWGMGIDENTAVHLETLANGTQQGTVVGQWGVWVFELDNATASEYGVLMPRAWCVTGIRASYLQAGDRILFSENAKTNHQIIVSRVVCKRVSSSVGVRWEATVNIYICHMRTCPYTHMHTHTYTHTHTTQLILRYPLIRLSCVAMSTTSTHTHLLTCSTPRTPQTTPTCLLCSLCVQRRDL